MAYGPPADDAPIATLDPVAKARRARMQFQQQQQDLLRRQHQNDPNVAVGSAGRTDVLNQLGQLRAERGNYEAAARPGPAQGDYAAMADDMYNRRMSGRAYDQSLLGAQRDSNLARTGYDAKQIPLELDKYGLENEGARLANARYGSLTPGMAARQGADTGKVLADTAKVGADTAATTQQTRQQTMTFDQMAPLRAKENEWYLKDMQKPDYAGPVALQTQRAEAAYKLGAAKTEGLKQQSEQMSIQDQIDRRKAGGPSFTPSSLAERAATVTGAKTVADITPDRYDEVQKGIKQMEDGMSWMFTGKVSGKAFGGSDEFTRGAQVVHSMADSIAEMAKYAPEEAANAAQNLLDQMPLPNAQDEYADTTTISPLGSGQGRGIALANEARAKLRTVTGRSRLPASEVYSRRQSGRPQAATLRTGQ